jgi:hypothetical protein
MNDGLSFALTFESVHLIQIHPRMVNIASIYMRISEIKTHFELPYSFSYLQQHFRQQHFHKIFLQNFLSFQLNQQTDLAEEFEEWKYRIKYIRECSFVNFTTCIPFTFVT